MKIKMELMKNRISNLTLLQYKKILLNEYYYNTYT